jgi:hypothetical protein
MTKIKNSFWDEHKLTTVPLLWCAGILAILGGGYVGLEKYNLEKYKRDMAKQNTSVVDSVVDSVAQNHR